MYTFICLIIIISYFLFYLQYTCKIQVEKMNIYNELDFLIFLILTSSTISVKENQKKTATQTTEKKVTLL